MLQNSSLISPGTIYMHCQWMISFTSENSSTVGIGILSIRSLQRWKNRCRIRSHALHNIYIDWLLVICIACGSFQDFLDWVLLLTRKLLNQGFLVVKSKSSLRKFYCHDHDLDNRYCEILFDFSFFSVRIPSVPSFKILCFTTVWLKWH